MTDTSAERMFPPPSSYRLSENHTQRCYHCIHFDRDRHHRELTSMCLMYKCIVSHIGCCGDFLEEDLS